MDQIQSCIETAETIFKWLGLKTSKDEQVWELVIVHHFVTFKWRNLYFILVISSPKSIKPSIKRGKAIAL